MGIRHERAEDSVTRTLPAFLLTIMLSLPAAAQSPTWAQLTVDEQTVLRPLQPYWETLPDYQRVRLLGAAKRYPAMSAEQRRRFSERLTKWASLTPEQREQARAAYREYSRMSTAERQKLTSGWFRLHPTKELAEAPR